MCIFKGLKIKVLGRIEYGSSAEYVYRLLIYYYEWAMVLNRLSSYVCHIGMACHHYII